MHKNSLTHFGSIFFTDPQIKRNFGLKNDYSQCLTELEKAVLDGFEIAKSILDEDYARLPQLSWDLIVHLGISIYCFVTPPKL